MHAKFINETTIQEAPTELKINERKYIGFSPEFLEAQGYKPVVFNPLTDEKIQSMSPVKIYYRDSSGNKQVLKTIAPEDLTYECYYVENDNEIVQDWRVLEKTNYDDI